MPYRTRALAVATATLIALPAFAESIMVMDPYARASNPAAKSGAAFMTLHNMSKQNDRLIAVRTDAAKRAELHTHKETGDGIMKMVKVEDGFSRRSRQKDPSQTRW